jgi:hypothetical protein
MTKGAVIDSAKPNDFSPDQLKDLLRAGASGGGCARGGVGNHGRSRPLLDDIRCKLALWRHDYNNVRLHSSLGNQTPAQARRAFQQFECSAHDALAQTDNEEYEIQTRKLSL